MNTKVDDFLQKADKWSMEMAHLRTLLLECGFTEDFKWNKPCYRYKDANVVVIQGFKAYCALLFFKGVLLNDPSGILVKTGENTRVGRQIRFTGVREIKAQWDVLKAYLFEAIEVEKAGLKVEAPAKTELAYPKELQDTLNASPEVKTAFEALTPGRQRAYIIYFSQAKQSKTRNTRIEKYIPHILRGKGLNDR